MALDGFNIFRCDRVAGKGGGVILYVKSNISCQQETTARTEDGLSELLVCRLQLVNGPATRFAVFYRSPSNRNTAWCSNLRSVTTAPHFVLVGDFNTPNVQWETSIGGQNLTSVETLIASVMQESRAYQHVQGPTRIFSEARHSRLDLLFTDSPENPVYLSVEEPIGTSDHASLWFELQIAGKLRSTVKWIPNVWRANFEDMLHSAEQLKWHGMGEDVDETWHYFMANMLTLYERHVPLKRAAASIRRPPWIDRELQRKLNARRRAWHVYRISRTSEDYDRYKSIRNICKSLMKEKRKQHEAHLVDDAHSEPHRVFTYINRRLRRSDELPVLSDENGRLVTEDSDRANLLANTYRSVFNASSNGLPRLQPTDGLEVPACSEASVLRLLNNLNPKKAPGPDGIHPLVLRKLAAVLAAPLAELFTQSMQSGRIPTCWKNAIVKPFFKGGDKHLPENYRPVNLTSVVGKVMERWVKEMFGSWMEGSGVLTDKQHGFTRNRSCTTNLLLARESWIQGAEQRLRTDVIYFDFSKAFDRVDHDSLIQRLNQYDCPLPLVKWTADFLHGRSFQVRVNGALSERIPAPSGVPQGSVLGPLLFNLYVNDIPEKIASDCVLFADDMKLWRLIKSDEDVQMLQKDINTLHHAAMERKLPINVMKCQHLPIGQGTDNVYKLNGREIPQETKVRDLGVLVSTDMKTKDHTNQACAKGFRLLWALKRSFTSWTADSVPKLMSAFVRPVMEFAAPAYFPCTKGECYALERVQRTATRMIPGLRDVPYLERCLVLDMFTLEYRRTRMDMIFVYRTICLRKMPTVEKLFDLATLRSTRGHQFKLEKKRLTRVPAVYSLPSRVVTLWNGLPENIVQATTETEFKRLLDAHLWSTTDTWNREPQPGETYPRLPIPTHLR